RPCPCNTRDGRGRDVHHRRLWRFDLSCGTIAVDGAVARAAGHAHAGGRGGERAAAFRGATDRPMVRAARGVGKRHPRVNLEERSNAMVTRRDALKVAAAAGLSTFAPAFAQGKRPLKVNLLGFALGIHVPTTAALLDILPGMGYAPETQRLDQIRTLTQTLIAGAAELGETDSITVMSAVEQGADLKIVGLWYMHTSLVFLANADKIREFKDLEKPENIVAINGKGDITHVMLLGPLIKRGVDV